MVIENKEKNKNKGVGSTWLKAPLHRGREGQRVSLPSGFQKVFFGIFLGPLISSSSINYFQCEVMC